MRQTWLRLALLCAGLLVLGAAGTASGQVATLETPGAAPETTHAPEQTVDGQEGILRFVACLRAQGLDLPDPQLARVAEESGGGYTEINFGDNLGLAFAQVAEELHSQYLLAYEPPKRDGKVHEIEVRVKQGGMKPRARKTYVAPK